MSFTANDLDRVTMKIWKERLSNVFLGETTNSDRRNSERFGKFSDIAQATAPCDATAGPKSDRSPSEDSEDCVIIEVPIPFVNLCTPDRVVTALGRRLPVRFTSTDIDDECTFIGVPNDAIDLCSPNEKTAFRNDPAIELCSQFEVFSAQDRRARRWSSDNVPVLEGSNCCQQDGRMCEKYSICKICFKRH